MEDIVEMAKKTAENVNFLIVTMAKRVAELEAENADLKRQLGDKKNDTQ